MNPVQEDTVPEFVAQESEMSYSDDNDIGHDSIVYRPSLMVKN